MPQKLNLKHWGKAATPSKKAMAKILRSRHQNEPTDDKASGSEKEYVIKPHSPTEIRMVHNLRKQITTVLEPVNVAAPPSPTTHQSKEGAQSSGEENSNVKSRS